MPYSIVYGYSMCIVYALNFSSLGRIGIYMYMHTFSCCIVGVYI